MINPYSEYITSKETGRYRNYNKSLVEILKSEKQQQAVEVVVFPFFNTLLLVRTQLLHPHTPLLPQPWHLDTAGTQRQDHSCYSQLQ